MSANQASRVLKRSWSDDAPYLPAEQLAAMIQVSAKTVYRWAAEDPTMPVLRIAGTIRFPRQRVLRWLQSREQGLGRQRSQKQVLGGTQTGISAENIEPSYGSCADSCARSADEVR